jgi:hypothetical protein
MCRRCCLKIRNPKWGCFVDCPRNWNRICKSSHKLAWLRLSKKTKDTGYSWFLCGGTDNPFSMLGFGWAHSLLFPSSSYIPGRWLGADDCVRSSHPGRGQTTGTSKKFPAIEQVDLINGQCKIPIILVIACYRDIHLCGDPDGTYSISVSIVETQPHVFGIR